MVSDEFNLRGKTALVAGDSRFWSKYAAAALAEAGANVAIAGTNSQKVEEAAKEVQRTGRNAVASPTDMTNSSQVQKMVEQVITKLGKIDILVNASDLMFTKPFLETAQYEWQRAVGINLNPVLHCCRSVGKHMIEQQKGRIINITSCLAERGLANGTAYCVATGSVLQFTKALALEWAGKGITVNAIGAGWFSETDSIGMLHEDRLMRYIPLKRYGHPGEIGSLVVYLASDTADFLTGQFWYADGAVMSHL